MRKHRGIKFIIVARQVSLYGRSVEMYDYIIDLEPNSNVWRKLHFMYEKIDKNIEVHRGDTKYWITSVKNKKFSHPNEVIKFMESYLLEQELRPKYKIKTFQFLRVNPYVRKAYTYTVHDKSVWVDPIVKGSQILIGQKKKKPLPKISMSKKKYISIHDKLSV